MYDDEPGARLIKKQREEIERLREELSLARLQRDAKLSSQTAMDEAAAREIERLHRDYSFLCGDRDNEIERLRNDVQEAQDKTAEIRTAWKHLADENERLRADNKLLRDVAVAAKAIDDVQGYDGYYREIAEKLGEALSKLREVE